MRSIILILASVSFACKAPTKKSEAKDTSTEQTPDPEPGTVDVDTTPKGTVALNVAALSSAPSFGSANVARNTIGEPGTLAVSAALTGSSGFNLTNAGWPAFHPTSITSGAPDGFRLTISKIVMDDVAAATNKAALKQEQADAFATIVAPGLMPALKDLVGKPYDSVDALLAAIKAAGVTEAQVGDWATANHIDEGSFEIPADESNVHRAVLFEKAEGVTIEIASGTTDLSALIAAISAATPDAAALTAGEATLTVPVGTYRRITVDYKVGAEIKGCVTGDFDTHGAGDANTDGVRTYCTRPGYSTFDAVTPVATSYEGVTADWMKVNLNLSTNGAADDRLVGIYNLPHDVEVKEGESVDVSMVLDLNRMLRFFNRGRHDQGPTPNSPKDRAYFFTTVFDSSVFMFLGKPGRIYGYEMLADACDVTKVTANTCTVQTSPIAFWLTIITGMDGKPLIASFMPDDDNTLTLVKGSTRGVTTPYTAGSGAGLVDIHYSLGSGELGHIIDFPANLEAAAVGHDVTGVTFHAEHEDGTNYEGPVYAIRRL